MKERLIETLCLEILWNGEGILNGKGDYIRIFGRGRPLRHTSKCLYCDKKPGGGYRSVRIIVENLNGVGSIELSDICGTCIPPVFRYAIRAAKEYESINYGSK